MKQGCNFFFLEDKILIESYNVEMVNYQLDLPQVQPVIEFTEARNTKTIQNLNRSIICELL